MLLLPVLVLRNNVTTVMKECWNVVAVKFAGPKLCCDHFYVIIYGHGACCTVQNLLICEKIEKL